jgi:hypothetical protein
VTSLHESASAIDRLPADQRAVLQMVLVRGHSYDEIARMLSIDRGAVRQRALAALDALGPGTRVSRERRALITDYLLGQLPEPVSEEVHAHLAQSAAERAWARLVASELSSLATAALPEIPAGALSPEEGQEPSAPAVPAARPARENLGPVGPTRPVSRLGGAILLGAVAAAAIAAILIFAVFGLGGSTPSANHPHARASRTASTTPSSSARPLAQINLSSPTHGKALGIAQVIQAGGTRAVVIRASGLQPNTRHDAYAVWLYNSPSSAYRLGYVKPGVGSNGALETAGGLPSNAGSYKELIVTLQRGPSSKPGKIVLAGPLSGAR